MSAAQLARLQAVSRFPRAAVVLEMLALAELMRTAVSGLESLANDAHKFEPNSMRRAAHALVRVLVAELDGQVVL